MRQLVFTIAFISFTFFGHLLFSQSDTEIETMQKKLSSLSHRMQNSQKKANILNKKIRLNRIQLGNLASRITQLESEIISNRQRKNSLETQVDKFKSQIKLLLIYTYKTRNLRRKEAFLFSAGNFHESYKRFLYIKFYKDYLVRQISDFKHNTKLLSYKNSTIKAKLKNLYGIQNKQTDILLKQQRTTADYNNLIAHLKTDKKKLYRKIEIKRKAKQELNNSITSEIKKHSNNSGLSSAFSKSKSKLPMPMAGVITQTFGKHKHKILEHVTINSNGIEITGTLNADVRAVYEGIVSDVTDIPGMGKAVIIKHGQFYTVYSNLVDCKVNISDKVKSNHLIGQGKNTPDDKNNSVLFFQIWRQKKKLNPELWIKK